MSYQSLFAACCFGAVTTSATMGGQIVTFEWMDQAFGANDLTPDGRYIVGGGSGGGYIWSEDDGYTFIGGVSASAVSDDGSVVFGQIDDPKNPGHYVAAIWNAVDGWQSLGGLAGGGLCPSVSSAYEISGDGSVGVGLAWIDGCDGAAFRWTEDGGMVAMESLANGSNRASVVSSDGQIAAGFAQGSFSRTPAIWDADGVGRLLDPPNGDVVGEVHGMNDDGSILLGEWDGSEFWYTEDAGVVTFDTPLSSWIGIAMDVSDDGIIVGFDIFQTARAAWIKLPGQEAKRLTTFLIEHGIEDTGLLQVPQAISTDGRVIIGHNAFQGGWRITLSPDPDLDGDGIVGFTDLLALLSSWGPCDGVCDADLNGDGEVGFVDLLALLSSWSS